MFEDTNADNPPKAYHVLARRKRPQSFAQLVGQEVVTRALESMIASGKVPHAFLFTGTRGTGKTSSARILAKSLCCQQGPTVTPCQTCVHCVQITACSHDDVLEIDGASNTGVDNVRELRESARFYPNTSRYRIFIIDEVHMLSIGAFNALLKILEEPPPQVVFILATTELHKVPITVRSRCLVFSFRKIETERMAHFLKGLLVEEGIPGDEDSIALVAREAKGSVRDALSLLEQVIALSTGTGGKGLDVNVTRAALGVGNTDLVHALIRGIAQGDAVTCLSALQSADAASLDLGNLLEEAAQAFRQALVLRRVAEGETARKLTQLLPSEIKILEEATASMSAAALSEIFRLLSTAARDVGKTSGALAWAEVAVIDCCTRAEWLSAGELLSYLSSTATSAAASVPSAAPQTTPASPGATPASPGATPASPGAMGRPKEPTLPAVKPPPTTPGQGGAGQGGLDLDAFGRVVQLIEKKSLGLATKLKHARLDVFSHPLIQFTDVPENKVFTQMTPVDATIFLECLKECGYGTTEIRGIDFPKGVTPPAPRTQQSPPGNLGQSSDPGASQAALHGIAQNLSQASRKSPSQTAGFLEKYQGVDVFGDEEPIPEKKNDASTLNPTAVKTTATPVPLRQENQVPQPHTRPQSLPARPLSPSSTKAAIPENVAQSKTVSLAGREHQQRLQAFREREEKVKSLPTVQKLAQLATKLEFLPLEDDEGRER